MSDEDKAEIVKLIAQRMRRLDPSLKPRLARFQAEQLVKNLDSTNLKAQHEAQKLLTTITGAIAAGASNKTARPAKGPTVPVKAPKWELVDEKNKPEEKKAAT